MLNYQRVHNHFDPCVEKERRTPSPNSEAWANVELWHQRFQWGKFQIAWKCWLNFLDAPQMQEFSGTKWPSEWWRNAGIQDSMHDPC